MASSRPSATSQQLTDRYKREAAQAAAGFVYSGMRVGLGTGSTVAHLLPALAQRNLDLACVATSPATEQAARALGLTVVELDDVGELDIAIDGADQITPDGWLIKGGGAAHTREKIVASAAARFVVIASSDKQREHLTPPVPLEVLRFGALSTLTSLAPARLRDTALSPDGNMIADYTGVVDDARKLSERLSETPGVVGHGLFAPEIVTDILIAGEQGIDHQRLVD